jgi:hypothetical protein
LKYKLKLLKKVKLKKKEEKEEEIVQFQPNYITIIVILIEMLKAIIIIYI